MTGYLVIDLETTGFRANGPDRIVELAAVQLDPGGEIEGEWSTLINPRRDVGASHIHGITASDIVGAPEFGNVAAHLIRSLRGRTLVAHNAPFDARFLVAELDRLGLVLPSTPPPFICTMNWSKYFVQAPSRQLKDVCSACGIGLNDAHSARGDAFATAALLKHFIALSGNQPPWHQVLDQAEQYLWPDCPEPKQLSLVTRDTVRRRRPDEWLNSLVSQMPMANEPDIDSYLATLDQALADGFLAEHEKCQLVDVAADIGLDRVTADAVHRTYMEALAGLAWEDGLVTEVEFEKLRAVASALGIGATDLIGILNQRGNSSSKAVSVQVGQSIRLEPGDRVCFTGEMQRSRSEWEQVCVEVGLRPGGLLKSTKILVAADPNSQSGKAAKARERGIPIVTEEAFAEYLAQRNH